MGRIAPPGQAPGRERGRRRRRITRRFCPGPGLQWNRRKEHPRSVQRFRGGGACSPAFGRLGMGPQCLARGATPRTPREGGATGWRAGKERSVRPVSDLKRRVAPFEVITDMVPAGDQPRAIAEMEQRLQSGAKDTVLLGATGTGKTATVAWLAERLQRPTLVMLPNKTLAAQFANELREMLPRNAVEYFVSYYDYYQPEAYVPQTDTYIEKDSSINDEVDRLRHSATNSLLTRRDTVVVASVSCIYGLGTPQEYVDKMLK